ncbi:unnamed protein product [Prorocentrum cordatum]|uniref:Uncharacterized protein n=1 Tax=Prorocentrum cordatum TaxID=2364126 RepID=A0ABN9VUJ4_9DINO|nr:unnamed protein product [Polarella glacialis]
MPGTVGESLGSPGAADQRAQDSGQDGAFDGDAPTLFGAVPFVRRAIAEWHSRIPTALLSEWAENMRESTAEIAVGQELLSQSGCSGTDAWVRWLQELLSHWSNTFGGAVTLVTQVVGAESAPAKRVFLREHACPQVLLQDVVEFKKNLVLNTMTGEYVTIPFGSVTGAGFSCASRSKMNRHRASNVGCVRGQVGSTGETFEAIKHLIVRSRAAVSFLECVVELAQEEVGPDGLSTSDADYIKESFEKEGFTAIVISHNPRMCGMPIDRWRLWVVIFNVPADLAMPHLHKFHDLLESMRNGPQWPVADFLIPESTLKAWTDEAPIAASSVAKRGKKDCEWGDVHSDAFPRLGLEWPPSDASLEGFRQRESEVTFAADKLHPLGDEEFSFLDANHTFERLFKWDPATKSTVNPWKQHVPTLTAQSRIVCRFRDSSSGDSALRHVHALEMMSFQGWDIPMWKGKNPFATRGELPITHELLRDMAGNMWNAGSFCPIAIAAFGALPYRALRAQAVARESSAPQAVPESCPASDSFESDSD